MAEKWCAFTSGGGVASPLLDEWLRSQCGPDAKRLTDWEPVALGTEWVGQAGFSLADSSPAGFQVVVLWRCRVEVPNAR